MWPSSPKMWLYNECKIWLMNTGQQQQKIFLRIPMKAILKSLKIIASHWAPLMIPLAKIRGDIYLMISWYVPVCHCIDDWIQCGVKVACRYHMMTHNHICKTTYNKKRQNIHICNIDLNSRHPLKCIWQNVFGCKEWQANSVSHLMHLWASEVVIHCIIFFTNTKLRAFKIYALPLQRQVNLC